MRRLRYLLVLGLLAAAVPQPSYAQPGDWGVKRDPFDKGTIARYKAILASNPHDTTALAKLLEMYRRYRTVDLLKEEYGKVLDKDATNWSALVVVGRLNKATGDDQRALEFFQKAVAKKDSDALTWLAIGELHKAATRNKATRSELKSRTKTAVKTIGEDSNEEAVRMAVKKIDSAASKGIIHKNTAARKKSRLMKKVNAAG